MILSPDIPVAEFEDLIDRGVSHLLNRHEAVLPDLGRLTVFISGSYSPARFRHSLLQQLLTTGRTAVIPPWTGTLEQWICENTTLQDSGRTLVNEQARRLLFIEALSEHPDLFGGANRWQLTRALLELFDELALNDVDAVESTPDAWRQCIERAYGSDVPGTLSDRHLHNEARIVHTLWHAWREELHNRGLLDATTAYLDRLRQAPSCLPADRHYYLLLTSRLHRAEQIFIRELQARGLCTVISPAAAPPAAGISTGQDRLTSEFIDSAFDYHGLPLLDRAACFADRLVKFEPAYSTLHAGNAETEARAVELQTRLWLLEGRNNIGIVSEDRKLSRRVRALLERAGVFIQDSAGWSLSTTSASAVLERWLECIEQDFDYRPMLDLLKSHFIDCGLEHETHYHAVYRLEQDIILHENTGHGLSRYRAQLEYRLHRLTHWPEKTYGHVRQLLDRLETASMHLLQLCRSEKAAPLSDYIDAVHEGMLQLGLARRFSADDAGMLVLATLEEMKTGLEHATPGMGWSDFRTWLGMALEDRLFSPHNENSPVRLMSLQQAAHQRFDALIIAAADREHLPGKAASSPFFNQCVRFELGLGNWEDDRAQRLAWFKHLLISADDILITCRREHNGEPVPASPWIEALQNFYRLINTKHRGGTSLENRALQRLLEMDTDVFICDTSELPAMPQRPAPSMPRQLLPARLSASAHQRLIDCPYRFYAGDALGLKAPDEIREELQKSDYGERVHRILNAFHTRVPRLPAPFTARLNSDNREAAIGHMSSLSAAVFKQDLEDNALHRSWLQRWMKHIPAYIDWQIGQQRYWQIYATEQKIEIPLQEAGVSLHGRLDRIDADGDRRCIIDYKTGSTPPQADVDSGEDVQLASYALLADNTVRVLYLSLDDSDGRVRPAASLENEKLRSLGIAAAQRLRLLMNMQMNGHVMPAWGDENVCVRCEFDGLCRRKVWSGSDTPPGAANSD